jgi:hypothetical protein
MFEIRLGSPASVSGIAAQRAILSVPPAAPPPAFHAEFPASTHYPEAVGRPPPRLSKPIAELSRSMQWFSVASDAPPPKRREGNQ